MDLERTKIYLGQNIYEDFCILTQFSFTTSDNGARLSPPKMNIQFTSQITERIQAYDFRKFQEQIKRFGIEGEYPAGQPKGKF